MMVVQWQGSGGSVKIMAVHFLRLLNVSNFFLLSEISSNVIHIISVVKDI